MTTIELANRFGEMIVVMAHPLILNVATMKGWRPVPERVVINKTRSVGLTTLSVPMSGASRWRS